MSPTPDVPTNWVTGGIYDAVAIDAVGARANAGINKEIVDAKGDLIVASDADTVGRLPVGSNANVLTADSTQPLGVKWAASPAGFTDPTSAKGDLVVHTASATTRLPVGTNTQVLTADSTVTEGVKWAASPAGFADPLTTKGDLIVHGTTTSRLPVGTNAQVLTADSTQTNGVKWAASPAGFANPLTTKGDLIVQTSSATVRQAVGSNGQVLTADSTVTNGVKWGTPAAGGATSLFANVVDSGADPTGVADSAAAFTAAHATGKAVFVPSGTYLLNSTPITNLDAHNNQINIIGAGPMSVTLSMAAGVYLVNTTHAALQVWVSGIRFEGGAGALRLAYTGATSGGPNKTVTDCIFWNFTKCGLAVYSSDTPFWKLSRIQIYAANETASIGIALAGWVDSASLEDIEIWSCRVGIKIQGTPNNLHIDKGWFAHIGATASNPRVAIWIVPTPSWSSISGFGGVIENFKFGNESLLSTDYHVLVADEGSGTNIDDKFPTFASASTGWTNGWSVNNCLQMNAGTTDVPLVYSTTPNLQGITIGPNAQTGSSSPVQTDFLRFKNATGFDPRINIVGPCLGFFDPYHPYLPLVSAQAGILTAQPPMLGQECNVRNVVTASGAITLDAQTRINIFTGTTATWTLPLLSDATNFRNSTGAEITIKNRGSGTLTVQRNTSDNIYTTSSVTSFTIAAGTSARLVCDGTYWVVL